MAVKEEIQKAIGAHGMWKSRLQAAIDAGKIDASVDAIRVDNRCEFGKWLYGPTLSQQDKTSPFYGKIKELHAEFHQNAAGVAGFALAGKKADAEKLLSGEFAAVSAKLTQTMMEWSKSAA